MSDEKLKNHIEQLKTKHYRIQQEINQLIHTHGPDDKIHRLKKEKLRIKDELENCEHKLS
jgi:hypothetical protein